MLGRWKPAGGSLGKCRAAEKQKEGSGGIGYYKQATPLGFQATRTLVTRVWPEEIRISFRQKTPLKMWVMTSFHARFARTRPGTSQNADMKLLPTNQRNNQGFTLMEMIAV